MARAEHRKHANKLEQVPKGQIFPAVFPDSGDTPLLLEELYLRSAPSNTRITHHVFFFGLHISANTLATGRSAPCLANQSHQRLNAGGMGEGQNICEVNGKRVDNCTSQSFF